ncbi:MAG: TlpA family protein disulfide reductase [Planctomycetes bacterium]|nr:TlpA family protein disulfide reductase [Planctomycetota bacterium]
MNTALLYLLMTPALAIPLDEGAAVELRYSGTLEPTGRDATGTPVKRFSCFCLLKKTEIGGHDLSFVIEERGGSGWAWPERFGRIRFDRSGVPGGVLRIKILHKHNGTFYPLEFQQPLFEFTNQIQDGAKWNSGRYSYRVGTTKKIGNYTCREIIVSTNFGRAHTIWVDVESPLVVKAVQRVVIGQGEIFRLTTELDTIKPIDENKLAVLALPLDALLTLKQDLGRKPDETQRELNESQIKSVSSAIEQLTKDADSTPFSRLVSSIRRDVKLQIERSEGVAGLVKRYTGQKSSEITLKSLSGNTIESKEHDGKIVLLHFWKYNAEPLREPYGQVGYLDFLNSRRRKLGVKVYGVAIDPRLTDKGTYSSAIRDIRKLTQFMNLSYSVTADDGTLLRKFGDPRRVGAELPLWVLVSADGKIAHYKVGFYDIKPDEGLKQLDAEVVKLIRQQRASEKKK